MNEFLDKMSAVLETPVTLETVFRDLPGWSSLTAFAVLVTMENDFGRRMTVAELFEKKTIGELAAACGLGV